jgi:uncharacterized membrane protein YjdF
MTLLPRPGVRNQRRLTRLMQLVLLGIVAYGVAFGQPKSITNGSIALLVTFIPAVLERRYDFPLDPWLGLWITLAVFLHSLGSAVLYSHIPWWDHLTHATSASLVAGVGYTFARAVDIHSDEIYFPSRFFFVYVLVVVLSFGVLWELFEFGLDVAADATGIVMPLSQHGLDDTVRDLMFNSVGALLVAALGQAHLSDVAESIRERFARPE